MYVYRWIERLNKGVITETSFSLRFFQLFSFVFRGVKMGLRRRKGKKTKKKQIAGTFFPPTA